MISVLIPTRHRLDKVPRAVEAIREHAAGDVEILLGIDADDAETTAWAQGRTDITPVVADRPDTLGAVTNRLADRARGDLMLGLADDMEILTPRWDAELQQVAARVAPKGEPFAFFLDDTTAPGFPSVWGVNRAWVRICGFACAPWFLYWWGDTWIMEVGTAAGRLFPVPVRMGQISGRGGTTGLREVPFWSDFFRKTRPLRMEMADAIAAAVHPPDVQQRLRDVRPQVVAELARMHEMNHSPARMAAMERALGTDTPPSERYLRARAAADRFIEEWGRARVRPGTSSGAPGTP